jgi:hypothetical protein
MWPLRLPCLIREPYEYRFVVLHQLRLQNVACTLASLRGLLGQGEAVFWVGMRMCEKGMREMVGKMVESNCMMACWWLLWRLNKSERNTSYTCLHEPMT